MLTYNGERGSKEALLMMCKRDNRRKLEGGKQTGVETLIKLLITHIRGEQRRGKEGGDIFLEIDNSNKKTRL